MAKRHRHNDNPLTQGNTMTDKKNDSTRDSSVPTIATEETSVRAERPVEVKPAVRTVQATPAKEQPRSNTNVDKMNILIANFEKAVKENDPRNNRFPGIEAMISMCEFLSRMNDPAVFETFFKYYMKNQDGTMFYTTALCGIHTIQNKVVKTRVSATNSVFQELARVRGQRKGVFHFTYNAMKLLCIGDALAKWVIAKAASRQ